MSSTSGLVAHKIRRRPGRTVESTRGLFGSGDVSSKPKFERCLVRCPAAKPITLMVSTLYEDDSTISRTVNHFFRDKREVAIRVCIR